MAKVQAVHYDVEDGNARITKLRLDDGREIGISDAVAMASRNELEGMIVGETRGDCPHPMIHGVADGDPSNNLSNLPKF